MLGCINSSRKKELTDELIQTDSEMMVPKSREMDQMKGKYQNNSPEEYDIQKGEAEND